MNGLRLADFCRRRKERLLRTRHCALRTGYRVLGTGAQDGHWTGTGLVTGQTDNSLRASASLQRTTPQPPRVIASASARASTGTSAGASANRHPEAHL